MWPILFSFIFGLAIFLERIISLNLSDINTHKFIVKVQEALKGGDVKDAQEICANTRGAVASISRAGLMRADEGIEAAEKAISAYGSIEMSFLERGLVWISLFITIAPLLGFLGTVVGMIRAFNRIAAAAAISPEIVASGIEIALLTTAFGLITGIILQVGYNYCTSKIDRIVAQMEESSIILIDSLVDMKGGRSAGIKKKPDAHE